MTAAKLAAVPFMRQAAAHLGMSLTLYRVVGALEIAGAAGLPLGLAFAAGHRRLQWRQSLVNEAGLRIGTTLDIARTTQELADLALDHFADLVTVDLVDSVVHGHDTLEPGPLLLHRLAQAPSAQGGPESTVGPGAVHTCPDGSVMARAVATGRPSRHTAPGSADVSGPRSARSTLVVPLTARGATLGVARFCRQSNPVAFDDEDLILAQEIAARAAVAVDNARRYTQARATALTLQRSLLPQRAAEQSAVDVACRYLPAGAEAGVGGDWYDIIPLSGARVALVVGDVVGHGINAAATMGRLRTAVRTLADIDLPPDELLTHLDDVVIRLSAEASADPDTEAAGDIGATCLYAVYDPVDGRCSLARAGHVLPAVVGGDRSVAFLDLPSGPPLGLGGLPFEAAEVDLPEGSLLALYTDGLVEARDRDIDAGLTLLRHALSQPATSLEAGRLRHRTPGLAARRPAPRRRRPAARPHSRSRRQPSRRLGRGRRPGSCCPGPFERDQATGRLGT